VDEGLLARGALSLFFAAAAAVSVLWGLALFRLGVAWVAFVLGAMAGAAVATGLGATPLLTSLAGLLGGVAAALLATSALRMMVILLGALGGGLLVAGIAEGFGAEGSTLALLAAAGGVTGALAAASLHDPVVAAVVALWGTGFVPLSDWAWEGSRAAVRRLPASAWFSQPDLVIEQVLAGAMGHPLQRLVYALGSLLLAWMLARLGGGAFGPGGGGGGGGGLRRLGLLCFVVALFDRCGEFLGLRGGLNPEQIQWLAIPGEALGLDLYRWPAAAALLWVVAGWARGAALPQRFVAAALGVVSVLLMDAGLRSVVREIPLAVAARQNFLFADGHFGPRAATVLVFTVVVMLVAIPGGERGDAKKGAKRGR
jgi:hypothetical protein